MSMRQTGAEFLQVTTGLATDLVELQRFNAAKGYYSTFNIQLGNLLNTPVQTSVSPITAQAGAITVLFSAPFAGTINGISATINGAITGSNIVITPSVYHAGTPTAVTGGVVTIPNTGSAVGTTATATPTANNTFNAGDSITATITGGTGTVNGVITLLVSQ